MQDSDNKTEIENSEQEKEYRTDPKRECELKGITGIFVRARGSNFKWDNFDIAELNRNSLKAFLRSRGGMNLWAENVVASILGHEPWSN